jgi:anaerobic ribonucleoside-triphosphate reductase activating protein
MRAGRLMPDNSDKIIYVYHSAIVEEILGSGRRLVIWTSGCPFKCPGCIEPKLQKLESGTEYDVKKFFNNIKPILLELKSVTFSGGEPLFQKDAMLLLLKLIKNENRDIDIMLYTGMTTECFNNEYREFQEYIDLSVTEPFIAELHSNLLWRGSMNQKIISPSGKYSVSVLQKWMNSESAGIKIHINENRYFIYGIPVPRALSEVNKIMEENYINVTET